MQTRHLKSLSTIAKTGSFAVAAESLGLTLSTVSMQIKALEKLLAVELFDRSVRPPALTPVGRRIAIEAEKLLEAETRLMAASSPATSLRGVWRLGFVATASVRLLPGFLKNAESREPFASFEFETALSEVLEYRVKGGLLDAAIVTASPQPTTGLTYIPLRTEPLVFSVPQAMAARPLGEIAQSLSFLQFNPGSGIGKLIEAYMHREFPDIGHTIILDNVEAIMECVNKGLGFTLLTKDDANRYGTQGALIHNPPSAPPSRQLVLAVPVARAQSPNMNILSRLFD